MSLFALPVRPYKTGLTTYCFIGSTGNVIVYFVLGENCSTAPAYGFLGLHSEVCIVCIYMLASFTSIACNVTNLAG